MKYFKKYPVFYFLMALLLALFVAGVAVAVYFWNDDAANAKKLASSMRSYNNALAEDPTQKSIDSAKKNIAALNERLDFLKKDLTRASDNIFKPASFTEGYQLREELRGLVNSWRRSATSKEIVVPEEMDFGFKKYVAPSAEAPKNTAIEALWKQACVLDYINKKLFNCKSEESPMMIVNIQREVLAEEGVATQERRRIRATARARANAASRGDNFKIDENITARKAGSLDTLAYRFVFAGHTDVLRRFLNQLKDFDAMLVVRSIDVRPADSAVVSALTKNSGAEEDAAPAADASSLAGAFGDSGEGAAAPVVINENKVPVVTDNVSEFAVVIEYVDVVTDKKKAVSEEKGKKSSAKSKK